MKALFRFHWDCGRMGELEGLFIATQSEVGKLFGREVYFGEVLGKHSEIYGIIKPEHIQCKITDQAIVTYLLNVFGASVCGYNPFDYVEDE